MFTPIPEILEDVRAGKLVILVDAEDRENEGDLVLAAQFATPEMVNRITRLAAGYLCLSMTEQDCDRLALHPQSMTNTSLRGTPFTVSIDGHPNHGVGTGISADDRSKTIQMAIDPKFAPEDFVRPGHINPLRSRDGGVLVRTGQTEGGVDLARLAGCYPSALVIEIVREDGKMARRDDLEQFSAEHGIKMCSIAQLIEHRLREERLVKRLEPDAGTQVETEFGVFNLIAFESVVDPLPQLALTVGDIGALDPGGVVIETDDPVLVRMHRRNLLGDIFTDVSTSPEGSTGKALHASMRAIQREGRGAIVYLRPSGMGGRDEQWRQRLVTSKDCDAEAAATQLADHQRDFGVGSQILRALGLSKLRLLTNHHKELPGLDAFGIEITEHVALDFS
jgi:3,4-dihydroxy 2-butanone 4-phosphate synthase/GTP cyclohydrolase II